MSYKYLENIATADAAFETEADNLNQLFKEAARATFNIMTDLSAIQPISHKAVELKAERADQLLFDWLSELVYLMDKEQIIFSKFEVDITKNKSYKLKAKVWGETIDLSKQDLKAEVKAITYHQFKLEERNGKWYARVVVDI